MSMTLGPLSMDVNVAVALGSGQATQTRGGGAFWYEEVNGGGMCQTRMHRYIHMHTHTQSHIHTHLHTYTHMDMHTYTHRPPRDAHMCTHTARALVIHKILMLIFLMTLSPLCSLGSSWKV